MASLDSEDAFLLRVMEIEKEFLASKRGVEMELGKKKKYVHVPNQSQAHIKKQEEHIRKATNIEQSSMFKTSCSPDKRVTSPEKRNKRMDLDDPKYG